MLERMTTQKRMRKLNHLFKRRFRWNELWHKREWIKYGLFLEVLSTNQNRNFQGFKCKVILYFTFPKNLSKLFISLQTRLHLPLQPVSPYFFSFLVCETPPFETKQKPPKTAPEKIKPVASIKKSNFEFLRKPSPDQSIRIGLHLQNRNTVGAETDFHRTMVVFHLELLLLRM